MRPEPIRELLLAQPFRPFTLVMATGEWLEAHHREFVLCPPRARMAVLVDRSGQMRIFNLALVDKLETEDSAVTEPPEEPAS